jgi:hypothetical protein
MSGMLQTAHRLGWGRGVWVLGVAIGLLAGTRVLADIAPRPELTVKALQSPNCPMSYLARAVAAKENPLYECAEIERMVGKATFACTFEDSGKVRSCEKQPGSSGFTSKQVACFVKELRKLSIPQAGWDKVGGPSHCTLQVEVTFKRPPYRRPRRYGEGGPIDLGL